MHPPKMEAPDKRFQIFSHSVAKAGKEKCGDAFAVRELAEENLVLLAVADGISSLPCDWLASKVACETVVAAFTAAGGTVSGRMKSAASKADRAVRAAKDSCRGMMTSLTLAVWETGRDAIHFLNVGDSRIYLGPEADLRQITVDDAADVLVRRDGEVVLNAGMPVFMRGVTRSLGQHEPLVFEVETCRFSTSDLLVLVSDGVCQSGAFTTDLERIFAHGNAAERLTELVRKSSEKNNDDATLVVLWRTETDEIIRAAYEECVRENGDFRHRKLNGQIVLAFLQRALVGELSRNANEKVGELIDYAARFSLKFNAAFLRDFLSLVIKQGTDHRLVFRLRELIKTSPN